MLEFILDYRSPYAYLANTQLKHLGTVVAYKPVDVIEIMKKVNNQPTPLCPAKARYAAIDAARWAKFYGVGFSPNAALFQAMREGRFEGALLSCAALAAQELGVFNSVNDALFKAVWAGADDLASEKGREAFLTAQPASASGLWRLAADQQLRNYMADQSQAAADRGVFGVPTFFVDDEMFFGNDRLDCVKSRLRNEAG